MLAAMAATAASAVADLAQSSPFMPSSLAASAAKGGPAGPVELRGVMSTSDGTEYCIYDTVKRTSAWVGLNEPGNAFVVKSADPNGESVTVEFQGRTVNLELRTGKVVSGGTAAPQQGSMVFDRSSITQSVVLNPSPADEQRRLDAVAAEVRRRRQERERASQAAAAAPQAPSR
jgi:hypothetical protein